MYKILVDYYPAEYCYKCSFCYNNSYHESCCILRDEKTIPDPAFEKPDWCPFNNAERIEE